MKNLLRTSAIAAAFMLSLGMSFRAQAQSSLVYDRSCNKTIAISTDNAVGCTYEVKDSKGKIVLTGKIKSTKTFYIATGKLGSGTFSFHINGNSLQEFVIR